MAWLAICDASTATGARAPDNNAAGIALPRFEEGWPPANDVPEGMATPKYG
jgi:hypothetical protein